MSAIASAYKITEDALLQACDLLKREKHQEVWKFLGTHEVGTLPYSGYVLAAVIPFAEQRGLKFPTGERVKSL